MEWSDVIADPCLQDLPYKIELNEHGSIVMTPASNRHGSIEYQIARAIDDAIPGGAVMVECAIETDKGVKVADVAWRSDKFLARHGESTPYLAAPEICVEVVSPSKSRIEREEKRELYFKRGAQEVWFYQEDGRVEYFLPQGVIAASGLVPSFSIDG